MLGHHIHTRSHPVAGQVADVRQVIRREYAHDARQRADCRGIDGKDPRVGVRRTQQLDTQGPGGRDQVRNVATAVSQEAFVFETYYRTADAAAAIGSRRTMRGQMTGLIHQRCLSDWRRPPYGPQTKEDKPSRPGELHPEPLTEPDLTLSRHPARAIARRLPPSIEHRAPPVAGWPAPMTMACSLRSTGITPLLSYYEAVRPSPAHRYFGLAVGAACAFSLTIADQVLTFHTKAWSSFAPPTRRMPLGQSQDILRARPGRRATPGFDIV